MSTYYEMLQVSPTATPAEIEVAYETQYNQWRRLVTHHDPNVVNQANQSLQALETIRETLTDPAKRAAYDAGIGLSGPIGGLADPSALLQSLQRPASPIIMTPSAPLSTSSPIVVDSARQQIAGLWHCVKCNTDNPPQTKFCFKCGNQLVRPCPECSRETSLVATGMCGECGYGYESALHRREVKLEQASLQMSVANTQKELEEVSGQSNGARLGCGTLLLLFGLFIFANSSLGGVVFLLIGGILVFIGLSSNTQRTGQISTLKQNIDQLNNKQGQLQAELETTAISAALPLIIPERQPQGATVRFDSPINGWRCSSCSDFVRGDAEFCKHCKAPFVGRA